MPVDDEELSALRASYRYRVTVGSMRLALLGFCTLLLLIAIGGLTGVGTIRPLLILMFIVTGLSVVVGWIGALTLVPATRRYTRAASGSRNFARQGHLLKALVRDLV